MGPLARLARDSGGLTLVELLVVVGIMTTAVGMVGSGIFQSLGIERSWRADAVATREWRHAYSWFASDALNAESTDLIDGQPPVASVTMTWTDGDGALHTSRYLLVGTRLVREIDGTVSTVAAHALSASFSLSAKVLTFDLALAAAQGAPRGHTLVTYLRMLK